MFLLVLVSKLAIFFFCSQTLYLILVILPVSKHCPACLWVFLWCLYYTSSQRDKDQATVSLLYLQSDPKKCTWPCSSNSSPALHGASAVNAVLIISAMYSIKEQNWFYIFPA